MSKHFFLKRIVLLNSVVACWLFKRYAGRLNYLRNLTGTPEDLYSLPLVDGTDIKPETKEIRER